MWCVLAPVRVLMLSSIERLELNIKLVNFGGLFYIADGALVDSLVFDDCLSQNLTSPCKRRPLTCWNMTFYAVGAKLVLLGRGRVYHR